MFGRKRRRDEPSDSRPSDGWPSARATVVTATFVRDLDETDMALFDFTVDVAADGGEPFRQTTQQKAMANQHPKIGDGLDVRYDPASREVVLDIDDDPRYRRQSNEDANAFNQRCGANLDEVAHLEKSGHKSIAVLTEVTECGWMRSLGQREFAVVADVTPAEGAPFTATFSIFDTTDGLYTPTVDQTIAVVYDDAVPPMVRAGTFWNQPTLELSDDEMSGPVRAVMRWIVPVECPHCGAPVDQSRESQAAHPSCLMCHNPLPCEPA
jgi:hypothetical protein